MEKPACSIESAPVDTQKVCVSLVPIFNHLPNTDLIRIAAMSKMRSFQRGELIHRAGDVSDQLYIVHSGMVKVYRLAENGKLQILRVLQPGDFMGELVVFTEYTHDSYAEAVGKAEICTIQRSDLESLLADHPAISMHLLSEMAQRLRSSEKQAASIATETVDARIGLYLMECVEQAGDNAIQLPMSRKDLASYLGIAPETLSRRLSDFQAAGWITQSGQRRIHILDLPSLVSLQ
ncbi:Crp/Fnr family transcriptional regulator [Alcaligenaceae bacterium]|nr:Crp/Fnr family transcriptional regulator [Alcaligenaceae bacterium]